MGEKRFFFWDGVRNINGGTWHKTVTCDFALSPPPKPVEPTQRVVATGEKVAVVIPDETVEIASIDPTFEPAAQLCKIELELEYAATSSLLVRIYADELLVYQQIFRGAGEIKRLPATDVRETGGRNPWATQSGYHSDFLKGARGRTFTVRAFIAPGLTAFDGVSAVTKLEEIPGKGDQYVPIVRRGKKTTEQRKQAEDATKTHGLDGVGKNQTATSGRAMAQFVAFHVRPGTRTDSGTGAKVYLGDAPDPARLAGKTDKAELEKIRAAADATDLAKRVAIMKCAIRTAAAHPGVDANPSVLKIFMAPEFYFRGSRGGYPVEMLSGILDALKDETDKPAYKDWLFVFGSAIGFLERESADVKFKVSITKAESKTAPVAHTALLVWADVDPPDGHMHPDAVSTMGPGWRFEQGAVKTKVIDVQAVWKVRKPKTPPDAYWIILEGAHTVTPGSATFYRGNLSAREVFNVAFVRKGGPAEQGKGLTSGLVYKEWVSSIDFLGPNFGKNVFGLGGDKKKIELNGLSFAIPTEGSRDLLSLKKNLPATNGGSGSSEVNRSGLGGGSIFTMEGITFGLEVCLDHLQQKLQSYYAGTATKGEPKAQIQLIPSWGMDIKEGSLATVPRGLVFNCDGSRVDSEAVVVEAGGSRGLWQMACSSGKVLEAADILKRVGGGVTPLQRLGSPAELTLTGLDWPTFEKYFQVESEQRKWLDRDEDNDYGPLQHKAKVVVYEPAEIPPPQAVR